MNIDVAGSQMIQQANHHSHKRNVQMAHDIHRTKHWSASLTKDTLTRYQEGIAVQNFDCHDGYFVVQKSEACWLVIKKAATIADLVMHHNNDRNNLNAVTRYHRLRRVTIDVDGFMSCTCPYSYNYLAPCCHDMMAVLHKSESIVPELFHIHS